MWGGAREGGCEGRVGVRRDVDGAAGRSRRAATGWGGRGKGRQGGRRYVGGEEEASEGRGLGRWRRGEGRLLDVTEGAGLWVRGTCWGWLAVGCSSSNPHDGLQRVRARDPAQAARAGRAPHPAAQVAARERQQVVQQKYDSMALTLRTRPTLLPPPSAPHTPAERRTAGPQCPCRTHDPPPARTRHCPPPTDSDSITSTVTVVLPGAPRLVAAQPALARCWAAGKA